MNMKRLLVAFLYRADLVPVRAFKRTYPRLAFRFPSNGVRSLLAIREKSSDAAAVVTVMAYDDHTKAGKENSGWRRGRARVDQTHNHNLRTKYLWTVIS